MDNILDLTNIPEETTETLRNRIGLISMAINRLISKIEADQTGEAESYMTSQTYTSSCTFILNDYIKFVEAMMDGSFDFDPNIQKLKGLIAHDLKKAYATLYNMSGLVEQFKEEILKGDIASLKVFEDMKARSLKYLHSMKGGFAIITSVNESNITQQKALLSIDNIVELLSMKATGNPNVFIVERRPTVNPLTITFNCQFNLSEKNLTLEELFSISTLIFNLTVLDKVKNGYIDVDFQNDYTIITVKDDAGYAWPDVISEYSNNYDLGYLNPHKELSTHSHGLGMVHFLSGQRDALYNIDKNTLLVECFNGNESSKEMKGVKLVFPHENLRKR